METIGEKISTLRVMHNMTQQELADLIECSKVMINRYEHNVNAPSIHILVRLALVFNTSTDYLVGMSDKNSVLPNKLYLEKAIQKAYENEPLPDELYYWKNFTENDLEAPKAYNAQTMWVGFSEDKKFELRQLRPVNPAWAIDVCKRLFTRPLIVNDVDDLRVLLLYGGQAVIRAKLVEEYIPALLKPVKVPLYYSTWAEL